MKTWSQRKGEETVERVESKPYTFLLPFVLFVSFVVKFLPSVFSVSSCLLSSYICVISVICG